MVRHTKSNARWRSSCRSVADGGDGTNSVGNDVASPICRPIMLYGSMIEQPARSRKTGVKTGVRDQLIRIMSTLQYPPRYEAMTRIARNFLPDFSVHVVNR